MQCEICAKLADKKKNLVTLQERQEFFVNEKKLHHRVHALNRDAHEVRMKTVANQQAPQLFRQCLYQFDWTRPFKCLSTRRNRDMFRNRDVPKLIAGIVFAAHRKMNYILVHAETVAHGVNTMLTALYFIYRADIGADNTGAAWLGAITAFLEMDGGSENTAETFLGFHAFLVAQGWWTKIESYRNITKHGHSGIDQRFYTMRYKGFYNQSHVTSFAKAVFLLLYPFRESSPRFCVLVVAKNWDWNSFLSKFMSPNLKWTARPLAWSHAPSTDNNPVPLSMYKDWGSASPHWQGEGGVADGQPLRTMSSVPLVNSFRPDMLPLNTTVVSKKMIKDVADIIEQDFLSVDEVKQMQLFLRTRGDIMSQLTVTGGNFDGGQLVATLSLNLNIHVLIYLIS